MRTIIATLLIMLGSVTVFCQLFDDFDDGDLSVNPTWSGNLNHFITNAEGILRLNADDPGRSFIYTTINIPDSFKLTMQLGLEFSPSNSNLARVYLFIDNQDPSKANGYYLNFGENGNDDAIRLFKLTNGSSSLLASGKLGAITNNINDLAVELSYNSNREWKLKASYDGKNVLAQEFVITEPWLYSKTGFFALECLYTATRRDKIYFDNILFEPLTLDTIPPTLTSYKVVNEKTIELEFSEEITYPDISNFQFNPSIAIERVIATSKTVNRFEIILQSSLAEGRTYMLDISNIKDLVGNVAKQTTVEVGLYKGPQKDEVIITEILFDPLTGGDDYVEFYNTSDKILNLKGCKIGNPARNQFITLTRDLFVSSKSYICFTNNPTWVRNNYNLPQNANIVANALPLYNATDGAVSLIDEAANVVDEILYTSKDHNKILNNVKGVSLERVLNQDGTYSSIWTSGVSSTNYGTPGYENANKLGEGVNIDDMFTIVNKTFSPNGNGSNDEVIISYQVPKSGFVADINIYGQDGYLIKNIANGEFIPTQGFFRWDGFNNKGELERIGVYLITGSLFHVDGDRLNFSHSCVLTNK